MSAFSRGFSLKTLTDSAREAGTKFAAQATTVSSQLNQNMSAYTRTRRATAGVFPPPSQICTFEVGSRVTGRSHVVMHRTRLYTVPCKYTRL